MATRPAAGLVRQLPWCWQLEQSERRANEGARACESELHDGRETRGGHEQEANAPTERLDHLVEADGTRELAALLVQLADEPIRVALHL